jgi:hypothetical protein
MILLQTCAGSKQNSYESMTMKTSATLEKAKPNTGNTGALNVVAMKHTTVQMSKSSYSKRWVSSGTIFCTGLEMADAVYICSKIYTTLELLKIFLYTCM